MLYFLYDLQSDPSIIQKLSICCNIKFSLTKFQFYGPNSQPIHFNVYWKSLKAVSAQPLWTSCWLKTMIKTRHCRKKSYLTSLQFQINQNVIKIFKYKCNAIPHTLSDLIQFKRCYTFISFVLEIEGLRKWRRKTLVSFRCP